MNAQQQRAHWRSHLLTTRQAIEGLTRTNAQRQLGTAVEAELRAWPAGVLGVYWPIRGEPDLTESYARLREQGWQLALPVVGPPIGAAIGQAGAAERERLMRFAHWAADAPLAVDRFGIALPSDVNYVEPSVVLVPCVGFDPQGFRLGYGAGFYDRWLKLHRVPAIGVAFDEGRLASVQPQAHDQRLTVVLTPAQRYWPSGESA